jgi:hypothetical protein
MSVANFTPDDDEPAVRNSRLRLMVDAARAEPAPVLRVDAAAVHAGWQEHRAGQRRSVAVGLSIAAAVVLGVGLWQLRGATDEPEVPVAASVDRPAPTPPVSDRDVETPVPAHDEPKPAVAEPTVAPTLAATIHVSPLEPTAGAPDVLGPRRLRLPDGSWSIDSEEAEPVEVALPDGMLELRGGSVHVKVAGDVVHVEVLQGEVLRVDLSGHRTSLRATPEPAIEPVEPTIASPGPAALAREAEALLAAGDRTGAIRTLRRLVTRHGRSAAAQGGLIDLGRLLKAAGQPDEARCAYGLFLERWPGHALAGDVTRARAALGDGPACDGLHPR